MNALRHFRTICVHKFWVGYYCFKAGLYWQGIVHDLSKFSPIEFIESAKYYQGDSSPIVACKKDKGYSNAWLHHKGRNPHHYEFFTDNYDEGTTLVCMPYKYNLEALCDYLGAGKAYYGKNFTYEKEYEWWLSVKEKKKAMHRINYRFIDYMLLRIKLDGIKILSNHDLTKRIYDNFAEEYNKGEK